VTLLTCSRPVALPTVLSSTKNTAHTQLLATGVGSGVTVTPGGGGTIADGPGGEVPAEPEHAERVSATSAHPTRVVLTSQAYQRSLRDLPA
jgi:hypothetical protein